MKQTFGEAVAGTEPQPEPVTWQACASHSLTVVGQFFFPPQQTIREAAL